MPPPFLPKHNNNLTVKRQKKEIATLLRDNKEEKARIRTEAIIREDFNKMFVRVIFLHALIKVIQ